MNLAGSIQKRIGRRHQGALKIRRLQQSGRRVSAWVNGESVWFECDTVPLRLDAYPFLLCFLQSAMRDRLAIRIGSGIEASRLENLPAAMQVLNAFWDYDWTVPIHTDPSGPMPAAACGARTGLFFSGGVDSLYSLYRHGDEVDDLVLIQGFDVDLDDVDRFEALRAEVGKVARKTGKGLIVVRTNIRKTGLMRRIPWARAHGGVLAAVGHLLADSLGRILISASYPGTALRPYGSHPLLDHLWSDGILDIRHVGDDGWRMDKIRKLAHWPVFQEHLVVCWEGKGGRLNCGRCEKCLRNQLAIRLTEHPAALQNFHDVPDPVARFDAIERLTAVSSVYTEALADERIEPVLKTAVRRLLERSGQRVPESESADASGWSPEVLQSRIENEEQRRRHRGGSPDSAELEAYAEAVSFCSARCTAVVLGMTPELRTLAASRFAHLVAFDSSPAAIAQYASWLPSDLAGKEQILSVNWFLIRHADLRSVPPVKAVFGDGIFGNLSDPALHRQLLHDLMGTFPEARLVFRKALAEYRYESDEAAQQGLREDYRQGAIGSDAFGFCIRLQGFLHSCYNPETCLLDNAAIFQQCDKLHRDGFFTDQEHAAIQRFRFEKPNCLLSRASWEALLQSLPVEFECRVLEGEPWYALYPIYTLKPRAGHVA